MRLNRGGNPRAQGKGPQVKYICIKGLKIPPLERILRENMDAGKVLFQHPLRIRPQEKYVLFSVNFKRC
jgi:hypothetical protein